MSAAKKAAKRAERERLRIYNEAKRAMPRTLALLMAYPEGPERLRAFELVTAAAEEASAEVERQYQHKLRNVAAVLQGIGDPIEKYITPLRGP